MTHLSGKPENVRGKVMENRNKSQGIVGENSVMENYCCTSVAIPGCNSILILLSIHVLDGAQLSTASIFCIKLLL